MSNGPPPPPPPPTTTTTTTGGGSSSSGGSSAPAPHLPSPSQAQLEANAQAAFRDILRRWGLPPTKNLLNLIDKAIANAWSTTYFVDRLRHTPEYQQKFQGIRWQDGMTEAQYNATFAQYRTAALTAGVDLTRQEFSKVLKRGLTLQEFSDRATALKNIEQWGPMFNTFSQVLEARGLGPVTKDGMVKMLLGGNKRWEKVYDETFLTAGLERVAGINVGTPPPGYQVDPYGGITRSDLLTLIKQAEALHPGFDPSKLDFAKIGQDLRAYKPEYLAQYGISEKDILEVEIGGPHAAEIADRAQRVLQTQQAFTQPRAVPNQPLGQQQNELPQSQ